MLAAVAAAAIIGPGCAQPCDLVRVSSGVNVELAEEFTSAFTVRLDSGPHEGTFRCDGLNGTPERVGDEGPRPYELDQVSCGENSVYIHETPQRLIVEAESGDYVGEVDTALAYIHEYRRPDQPECTNWKTATVRVPARLRD